jgi:two-component system, LytTR family, sensor histidine kinase AlgZ
VSLVVLAIMVVVQDSQLLSSYQDSRSAEPVPAGARGAGPTESPTGFAARQRRSGQGRSRVAGAATNLIFDACHVGVVLRAVLVLEATLAVASGFAALDMADWFGRFALLTGGGLPAVLLWLVLACILKNVLARVSLNLQVSAGVALGAMAGIYGWALLWWFGVAQERHVLPSALAGAQLAAVLVAALVWRSRAQMPAATVARLAELQSRIRPHFLFNTLNSAIALVRDDPKRAEAVLEDLSELFHHALVSDERDSSLADELELAQRYLAIEQVRFGTRMQVEWALDASTHGARLPALVLQPLVENAVKHGVETSAQPGQIKISTVRRAGTVVIRVTNTVDASAPTQAGHGIALANVRDRLNLLHDLHASFQTLRKDGVFQARIEVPLAAESGLGGKAA